MRMRMRGSVQRRGGEESDLDEVLQVEAHREQFELSGIGIVSQGIRRQGVLAVLGSGRGQGIEARCLLTKLLLCRVYQARGAVGVE